MFHSVKALCITPTPTNRSVPRSPRPRDLVVSAELDAVRAVGEDHRGAVSFAGQLLTRGQSQRWRPRNLTVDEDPTDRSAVTATSPSTVETVFVDRSMASVCPRSHDGDAADASKRGEP